MRNVSCVGCGPVQENFVGCADISIKDPNQPDLPTTTSTKTTTTLNMTSTTQQISSTSTSSSTYAENHEDSQTELSSTSSVSSSTSSSSSSQISTTSSISPLTSLITSRTTSAYNGYNGCKSKLEFGTMIDLSREIALYCYRMCSMRCDTIISEMDSDSDNDAYKSNPNYVACTQTCPQLCLCN